MSSYIPERRFVSQRKAKVKESSPQSLVLHRVVYNAYMNEQRTYNNMQAAASQVRLYVMLITHWHLRRPDIDLSDIVPSQHAYVRSCAHFGNNAVKTRTYW